MSRVEWITLNPHGEKAGPKWLCIMKQQKSEKKKRQITLVLNLKCFKVHEVLYSRSNMFEI